MLKHVFPFSRQVDNLLFLNTDNVTDFLYYDEVSCPLGIYDKNDVDILKEQASEDCYSTVGFNSDVKGVKAPSLHTHEFQFHLVHKTIVHDADNSIQYPFIRTSQFIKGDSSDYDKLRGLKYPHALCGLTEACKTSSITGRATAFSRQINNVPDICAAMARLILDHVLKVRILSGTGRPASAPPLPAHILSLSGSCPSVRIGSCRGASGV